MRRGTTPAITLTVDTDLTGWTVYVTLRNSKKLLTLENDRLTISYANDKSTVAFALTQEETLAFSVGTCEVQIRAIHDGSAIATNIQNIDVGRIILEGVIHE